MVKKIRVIDEPKDEELDAGDANRTMIELAKSMDWKLWELLQTMQRLEKKLTVLDGQDVD